MIDSILQKLIGVRRQGTGYQAKCPAHEDDKPSLSISEKDGKVLIHCHAGCALEDICGALAIEKKDLFEDMKPAVLKAKKIVGVYDYKDETGDLLYQCVRYDPKDFRQRRPEGDKWIWNLNDTRLVPYRLPELVNADRDFPVFICEGEKDVDGLAALGLTATCNPLGALKWKDEYNQYFAGFHCVILPDNDETGVRHTELVAKSLVNTADRISILSLPRLAKKGDVSDWLAKETPGRICSLYLMAPRFTRMIRPAKRIQMKTNFPSGTFLQVKAFSIREKTRSLSLHHFALRPTHVTKIIRAGEGYLNSRTIKAFCTSSSFPCHH